MAQLKSARIAVNAITGKIFIISGFWYFRFGPGFLIIIINSLSNKWLIIAIIVIKCFVVEKLYILALILFYLGLNSGDQ
jgi:hypothetical protein